MNTSTTHPPATRTSLARGAAYGAGAGVIASVAMGMYAMVASFLKDTGFFTPLHHIASLFAAPDSMMQSMNGDMADGNAFVVAAGVAALGAIIHMMTGAMYGALLGAVLAVVLARTSLGTPAVAGIGLLFGALVFAVSAFVALPLAAAITGAGDPIADMASMAGWGTFFTEHLLFGLVAALLLLVGLRKRA